MYNLPPDWGSYYRTCPQCMARYHASGTLECNCKPCARCGDLVYCVDFEFQEDMCDSCYGAVLEEREEGEE